MKQLALILAVAFALHLPAASLAMQPGERYLLGPGDVIEISVWQDETLSRVVRIRPDGKISYPLVGEVQAAGRPVIELQQEIQRKVAEFVPNAPATVILQESASKRFYVVGKVNSPGVFPMLDATRVMQALALAGGLTEFADEDIVILREQDGKQTVMEFDYADVEKGRDLRQNIYLQTGDTIVVR